MRSKPQNPSQSKTRHEIAIWSTKHLKISNSNFHHTSTKKTYYSLTGSFRIFKVLGTGCLRWSEACNKHSSHRLGSHLHRVPAIARLLNRICVVAGGTRRVRHPVRRSSSIGARVPDSVHRIRVPHFLFETRERPLWRRKMAGGVGSWGWAKKDYFSIFQRRMGLTCTESVHLNADYVTTSWQSRLWLSIMIGPWHQKSTSFSLIGWWPLAPRPSSGFLVAEKINED